MDNGGQIAAAIYLYNSRQYSKSGFPTTLNDLVSAGLLKSIPQCKCADGKMRDFIYISGFNLDMPNYVILASPPEMDSKVTIVYYGGVAKILPRSEAAKEIDKSRAFVKAMQQEELEMSGVKPITPINVTTNNKIEKEKRESGRQ